MALERNQVGRCGDDAGVGQKYDLEGHSPHRCTQSAGLPKRGAPEQAGHAGGGKPTDAPPCVAQLGYSDSAGLHIMLKDILFGKSPKSGGMWIFLGLQSSLKHEVTR